jgi:RNA polymerase sigma-70 factor, ECF subfamily
MLFFLLYKEGGVITAKIFSDMYPKLLRYALSLTKRKAAAEDIVMEVITKLLGADNLPVDVNIEAYAMRSVKNLFLNTNKKESREVGERNEDGDSVYETTEDPTSGRFIDDGDLNRMLMGMEIKCREILTLHALGNSYKEISEVLAIKAGTVMSRMARCREHLDPIMGER